MGAWLGKSCPLGQFNWAHLSRAGCGGGVELAGGRGTWRGLKGELRQRGRPRASAR